MTKTHLFIAITSAYVAYLSPRLLAAQEALATPAGEPNSRDERSESGRDAAAMEGPGEHEAPEFLEVSIREEAAEGPIQQQLRASETRLLAGAFGDPLRAIEALPGVLPLVSGLPYFYVRGAPPGNVGYFLDGIRVPLLFHMGLGPSVIAPQLISEVRLTPGNDPEHGRYLGGTVQAELSPPRDRVRAEGSLRAVDTGSFIEVPWEHGSAMAAGRVSYSAWLFSLANSDTALSYWDYAARLSMTPHPDNEFSVFVFGAYDYLADKHPRTGREQRVFDTTFHRARAQAASRLSLQTQAKAQLVLGYDLTRLDQGRAVEAQSLAFSSEVDHLASEEVRAKFGFDALFDDYSADLDRGEAEGFTSYFSSRTDRALGAFVAVDYRPSPQWSLRPAVRSDVYASGEELAVAVSPSVEAALLLSEAWRLVQKHGIASQPPSFLVPGPGFVPGLERGGLQHAFHSSFGIAFDPAGPYSFGLTLYRSAFFDLADTLGTSPLSTEGFPDGFDEFDERVDGQSYGVELLFRKRLARGLGFLVAYTLGRSERSQDGQVLPSAFDRTHVLSAALSADFGAGFFGGLRQLLYSGAPILEERAGVLREVGRLAPFYRVDWRFEKRFRLGRDGHLALVAEVANTFLASEQIGRDCTLSVARPPGSPVRVDQRCSPTTLGPVAIPSLGVSGGY